MRDERTVITMDLVLEDMKKELKRIGFTMAAIYLAVLLLLGFPLALLCIIGIMLQDYAFALAAVFSMLPYFALLSPFVVIHAIQIIRRIRMIRNPDFTVSTQELLTLEKKFNLWFYLFSIERFLYPAWLVLIRAFQPVMSFATHDRVFVDKRIADYSFVGDRVHLIVYNGKVVGVYNSRLYRREDEQPTSKSWD